VLVQSITVITHIRTIPAGNIEEEEEKKKNKKKTKKAFFKL
jgi:hypothetical protein